MENSIKILSYNSNTEAKINTVFPWFKLQNTGNSVINLSDVKVCYYYTIDGPEVCQNFWCDWCNRGAENVTATFVKMRSPMSKADHYIEIGFKANAGKLVPGESIEVQSRFAKSDWSNFNQLNHYSFNQIAASYSLWDKVSGFISERLVWGEGISLDKSNLVLKKGDNLKLNADISPIENANPTVVWGSSNPDIADVNQEGLITAKGGGIATIIATSSANGFVAKCQVAVHGFLMGKIKEAASDADIHGVNVSIYDKEGYTLVGSDTTQSDGTYLINLAPGEYKIVISKENYITVEGFVNVQNSTSTYNTLIKLVPNKYTGSGTIEGHIKNAHNNEGIGKATINLRRGFNVIEGEITASALTNEDGGYMITVDAAGCYTGEIIKDGFIKDYFTVESINGITNLNQHAYLVPNLQCGQTSAVLTWGTDPRDLDAHLTGPTPDCKRFHISYPNIYFKFADTQYAKIEVDDADGYGPESITILKQIGGIYRFSVHDFSGRSSNPCVGLANSNAKVKVYRENALVSVYNVPLNLGGTVWTVFEIDESNITPVNKMTYASEPAKIN
ncbi:MAG TPA: cellulose binding domain-containing protein [Pseudobacteroides sp.]|uniref:cellulose binding domain-containing protein n=1 Tax=Pseudobacteroides sp. TaxID=1968840 RepID=UPI002F9246F0